MHVKVIAAGCAMTVLSGCEEQILNILETSLDNANQLVANQNAADETADSFYSNSLMVEGNKVATTMPSNATAVFEGNSLIVHDTDVDGEHAAHVGQANLVASFSSGNGTITGDMDGFAVTKIDDATKAAIEAGDFSVVPGAFSDIDTVNGEYGSISVTSDRVFPLGRFTATLDGSLNDGETETSVTGTAPGRIYGPGTENLTMNGDTSNGLVLDQDGVLRTGTLTVFGRQ